LVLLRNGRKRRGSDSNIPPLNIGRHWLSAPKESVSTESYHDAHLALPPRVLRLNTEPDSIRRSFNLAVLRPAYV
jgi:hypothetical protein